MSTQLILRLNISFLYLLNKNNKAVSLDAMNACEVMEAWLHGPVALLPGERAFGSH